MLNIIANIKNSLTFVSTVLATLPIRTASQGESFAFITFLNTPLLPINDAHFRGFFFSNRNVAMSKPGKTIQDQIAFTSFRGTNQYHISETL
ncbi:MAG: hypothetical protein K0R26_2934 [Bacteroidota bacterium]|jgi:hypothetical protein|nr:hypothetical protein [Bacteroidota bacterium]